MATKYQIGWMAIGVGFLVGFSVRRFGRGTAKTFGIIGAVSALPGCLLGNLLSACGFIAQSESAPVLDVVFALLGQPVAPSRS